ncbi:MAG TPA: hypothetical protein VK195_10930 [Burkholderiaceae bacterium]|nr:hypothetical protein [Burkholderiaceae bacterium]
MTPPLSLQSRVRSGLKHRLLCGGFFLALLPAFAYGFVSEPAFVNLLPALACLVGAALGFMAPLILTQGWSRPMPSSRHLPLCTPAAEKLLAAGVAGLLVAPPLLRLFARV